MGNQPSAEENLRQLNKIDSDIREIDSRGYNSVSFKGFHDIGGSGPEDGNFRCPPGLYVQPLVCGGPVSQLHMTAAPSTSIVTPSPGTTMTTTVLPVSSSTLPAKFTLESSAEVRNWPLVILLILIASLLLVKPR